MSIRFTNSGWVAEWLCRGLQILVRRFDSDPSLNFRIDFMEIIISRKKTLLLIIEYLRIARVVELVDTRDLKSLEGNFVPVRLRPRAPFYVSPNK